VHALHSNIATSVSVGSLNNDRTVMSSTYAWRPLACLPILKTSAFSNVDKDWQAQRRLALYHNAMAHIVADINDLCSTDRHYRFADKISRCGRGFWHFLSLDGAEIAAATLCGTDKCPTCECPKSELDNTETQIPLLKTSEIKEQVEAGRARLLNPDGTASVKQGKKTEVCLHL
jgi:hypothetical protein